MRQSMPFVPRNLDNLPSTPQGRLGTSFLCQTSCLSQWSPRNTRHHLLHRYLGRISYSRWKGTEQQWWLQQEWEKHLPKACTQSSHLASSGLRPFRSLLLSSTHGTLHSLLLFLARVLLAHALAQAQWFHSPFVPLLLVEIMVSVIQILTTIPIKVAKSTILHPRQLASHKNTFPFLAPP